MIGIAYLTVREQLSTTLVKKLISLKSLLYNEEIVGALNT